MPAAGLLWNCRNKQQVEIDLLVLSGRIYLSLFR